MKGLCKGICHKNIAIYAAIPAFLGPESPVDLETQLEDARSKMANSMRLVAIMSL